MAGTDERITLVYLRRYPDSARSKAWAGKLVHIETEHGIWRNDAAGYTRRGAVDAWVLPFEDALLEVAHLGPEKRATLLLATPPGHPREGGDPGQHVEQLTFQDLRTANEARQAYWGGIDNWTLADWSNAVAGEVGEACNVVKKLRRAELGTTGNKHDTESYRQMLASEIGDVVIYLDLLARAAGFTLDHCARLAFNDKSIELNMPVHLTPTRTPPAPVEHMPVTPRN